MNKERGELKFKLGDETFVAVPNHRAMAEIESEVDLGIFKLAQLFYASESRSTHVAAVLYYCVREKKKEEGVKVMQTLSEFHEMIFDEGIMEVQNFAMILVHSMVTGKTIDEVKAVEEQADDEGEEEKE